MNINLTEHTEDFPKRLEALHFLSTHAVQVGLPSNASPRNRMILAIQEHGSPIMHIPPRPVVEPALQSEETQTAMAACFLDAIKAACEGDLPAAQATLEQAGQTGADAIRAAIDEGVPPPNSPVTISGGWIYNHPAHKGVYVKGKGFDKPLYDTGELYNAFSYEITET